MSIRQLDNEAPTIYAPTAGASTSRRKSGKAALWETTDLEDYYEDDSADSGSGEEGARGEDREEIDADEVYGTFCS